MKKSVILLILLVIVMPISYAYEEKTYIYGNGLIASKDDNNQITYYHQDFLGSNRFTTNMHGELIGKSVQEPYGSELSDKGTKVPKNLKSSNPRAQKNAVASMRRAIENGEVTIPF